MLIDFAASVSLSAFQRSQVVHAQIYPGSVTEMAVVAGWDLRLISVVSSPPLLLLQAGSLLCYTEHTYPTQGFRSPCSQGGQAGSSKGSGKGLAESGYCDHCCSPFKVTQAHGVQIPMAATTKNHKLGD